MGFTTSLRRFVESNALRESTLGHSLATLSAIDDDEHLWRRLTQTDRDLGSLTHERQREIAAHLYDTNPFAKRILNMQRDFICGDGWTLTARNEAVQECIDAHWYDPLNNWPQKIFSRVLELGMFGEQCYTAVTGEDGVVRLAYVDPGVIAAVRPNGDNYEILDEVILKRQRTEDNERRLKVIKYDLQQQRVVGKEGQDGYAGQCFFWAINKPTNATRGRSDLFCLSDNLDMLDRFHWNRMEKHVLTSAFFWDVLVKGADEKALKEYAKGITPPKPGSMRFHNESVEWEAVTPNLQASDASEEGRMMRVPLLTGSGIPEHWFFGVGDNANRASSYEMSDPPMRMFRARQLFVASMVNDVLLFQIDEALAAGKFGLGKVPEDELHEFEINMPELSSRDMAKASSVLVNVSNALLMAGQNEWISTATARKIFAFSASTLGINIDPEAEAEQIEKEQEEQDEKDFAGAPGLPAEEEAPTEEVPAEEVPAEA